MDGKNFRKTRWPLVILTKLWLNHDTKVMLYARILVNMCKHKPRITHYDINIFNIFVLYLYTWFSTFPYVLNNNQTSPKQNNWQRKPSCPMFWTKIKISKQKKHHLFICPYLNYLNYLEAVNQYTSCAPTPRTNLTVLIWNRLEIYV